MRFFQKTLHSHDWQTENDSTNQKQHWVLLIQSWRRCLLEEPHLPTITLFYNSTSIRLSNMVCWAYRFHGENTATTRYRYPFVHLDSQVFEIHFVKNFIIAIILVALISHKAGMGANGSPSQVIQDTSNHEWRLDWNEQQLDLAMTSGSCDLTLTWFDQLTWLDLKDLVDLK